MNAVIEVEGLTKRFRDMTALDDVSFTVEADTVTGLLGRNGAGKTTLMSLLTGQAFASAGRVRVFGEHPVENDRVLARMCFVRENQKYPHNFRVRDVVTAAASFHPGFDRALAERLVDDFDLPRGRQVQKLSRGMTSAVGIVVGLASRAPVTFFDEPYLGLDATARQIFYDRLMDDYAEHPRTIVLSTHLIDEVSALLEAVLVVDAGRLVVADDVESLRGSALTLVGRAAAVDRVAAGLPVLQRETLGTFSSVTVRGPVGQDARALADELSVALQPVSLQQLVMSLSGSGRNAREGADPAAAQPPSAPLLRTHITNGGTR